MSLLCSCYLGRLKRLLFSYGVIVLPVAAFGLLLAVPAAALAAAGWAAQTSTNDGLCGIAFPDATHGWVVAFDGNQSGIIFNTTNGGTTWKTQYSAPSSPSGLLGVAFANTTHGWAVGEGTILATTNGGATWKTQDSSNPEDFSGVACADANHAWAVSSAGDIVGTTNGGTSWHTQSSAPPQGPYTGFYDLYGVACANTTHAWAVGVTYDTSGTPVGGVILATTNGGTTWKVQAYPGSAGFSGVTFANASDGWAVGATFDEDGNPASGVILGTTNGGATWKAQTLSAPTSHSFAAVACANASDAWAVGDGGAIYTTMNGGSVDWRPESSTTTDYLSGVTFAGNELGWAVGYGVILHTTDGGYQAPTIASFSPTSGAVGSTVTIKGAGFYSASKVSFNGVAATSFKDVDHATITAVVPSGATSGKIAITTAGGAATSASSFTVSGATAPVNTVLPKLGGSPIVGQAMTCSSGTWSGAAPTTYSYQWLRSGTAIGGATKSSYTVASADLLHGLSCTVTAKNSAGSTSVTTTRTSIVPKLTLKSSLASLKIGSSLTLSGSMQNVISGYRTVTIARVTSGGWKTLKTVTLFATNTFSTTYKPTATGSWQFIATYKPGTTLTYASNTVTVSVHS